MPDWLSYTTSAAAARASRVVRVRPKEKVQNRETCIGQRRTGVGGGERGVVVPDTLHACLHGSGQPNCRAACQGVAGRLLLVALARVVSSSVAWGPFVEQQVAHYVHRRKLLQETIPNLILSFCSFSSLLFFKKKRYVRSVGLRGRRLETR